MAADTVDTDRPEPAEGGGQDADNPAQPVDHEQPVDQDTAQETEQDLVERRSEEFADEHAESVDWLQEQFPEWAIEVAATSTWSGPEGLQPIWIAHRDGHHPQSELSAGKLHTRLSEYEQRKAQRQAMMN